jgi:hypothetical protein
MVKLGHDRRTASDGTSDGREWKGSNFVGPDVAID